MSARTLFLLSALLVSASCNSQEHSDEVDPIAAHATWALHGEDISKEAPVQLTDLFDRSAELDGQQLIVEGPVEAVCLKKGCWMTMKDGDNTMRVTFKDYGFFVPMDIAGRKVRFEGEFAMKEVSAADRKHYLEDEGRHEEAAKITGPMEEYTFVASGVRIAP